MSEEKLKKTEETAIQEAPVVEEQPAVEPASEAAATSTDEQQIPMVVTLPADQVLNLREGPSREFRVLEQIPAQTEVQAVPMPYGVQVPGWQLIRLEERVGWVATDYLQPKAGG